MSRTELHLGKIRKIDTQDKLQDDFALDILEERNKELDDFYSSPLEQLVNDYYKEFLIANGDLYEILEDREFEDSDIAEGYLNPDGSISYVAMYYNGATGLTEVLEEIVEKIKK